MARRIVGLYTATMIIDSDADARRGAYNHLDPSIETSYGWWVDCRVFIPDEDVAHAS